LIFSLNKLREKWEEQSQKPFPRLVSLFVGRVFHGSGESGDEELDFSTGLVLSLLALPGAFYSILLFDKYGSFLQWVLGHNHIPILTIVLPDEYFLIVLSMVVTGAAAVWRWDSIFPDRRDYANLVPLPISTRTIFLANLTAIFFVAGLLALDVNVVSGFLFPFVASASQEKFTFFLRFAEVHVLAVLLASLFSFFAIFTMVGILMTVLPYRGFRKLSLYLRGFMMACLVAILSTSFAVPPLVVHLPQSAVKFLPPVWFLGLCQRMHGSASPSLAILGDMALVCTGCFVLASIAIYAISYRRCFKRIPENVDADPGSDRSRASWIFALLDRIALRGGFQRAGYRFVIKSLLRSERHSLILGGFLGLGIVIASQVLFTAFNGKVVGLSAPSAEILSIPFIVSYCLIVGLYFAFSIPMELRANWVFQLLLDKAMPECIPLARKILLTFVVPWVMVIILPLHIYLWGWMDGLLHVFMVTLWALLLADILLLRFRKVPFTCSYPSFRNSAIMAIVIYLLGFFVYAILTSQFESWMLLKPARVLLVVPLAAGIWYALSRFREDQVDVDKQVIFEDKTSAGFEVLDLST
jgi:hypothetical protein